jgi:phosphoribosylglycinamide formyltransferase 1
MKRFAVFASGRGSNLGAIIEAIQKKEIAADLALVVSDQPTAFALERARKANIAWALFDRKQFEDKAAFEDAIIAKLREFKIDFIVLAGYMRILSPHFVHTYRNRIINIHPSYLPAFKGGHAIKDAFDAKVKETGVTVHFVDEQIDHGAVIIQERVPVLPEDTLESLEERIHKVEHRIYSRAIDQFACGKFEIRS